MALLEVNQVTKSFGSHKAVDAVSFFVEPGKIYGLLGPNGAGKTTTIRMIMNIILPDNGDIRLFGEAISEQSKAKIGYLPEERGIFQKMKVSELLVFFAELQGLSVSRGKELSVEWLQKMQLSEWADHKVEELSKGMQQKIQFVATILHNPDLVILDEPFSGLDPVNVNLLKDIMLDIKAQGKTIIFSTHMMDAAEKLCDDILMIDKGQKVLDGSINKVRQEHGKDAIRIEYRGDGQILKDCALVDSVQDYSNYAEISLTPSANLNDLLKLILPKLEILSITRQQSSLNEIFLNLAGGNGHD